MHCAKLLGCQHRLRAPHLLEQWDHAANTETAEAPHIYSCKLTECQAPAMSEEAVMTDICCAS